MAHINYILATLVQTWEFGTKPGKWAKGRDLNHMSSFHVSCTSHKLQYSFELALKP